MLLENQLSFIYTKQHPYDGCIDDSKYIKLSSTGKPWKRQETWVRIEKNKLLGVRELSYSFFIPLGHSNLPGSFYDTPERAFEYFRKKRGVSKETFREIILPTLV